MTHICNSVICPHRRTNHRHNSTLMKNVSNSSPITLLKAKPSLTLSELFTSRFHFGLTTIPDIWIRQRNSHFQFTSDTHRNRHTNTHTLTQSSDLSIRQKLHIFKVQISLFSLLSISVHPSPPCTHTFSLSLPPPPYFFIGQNNKAPWFET